MKFTIEKDSINKAVQQLNTIVPSKDAQTLLSNILIQTQGDTIHLTTSDMESTARISLKGENIEDGSLILKASKFAEAVNKIKAEKIQISSAPNTAAENEMVEEENPEKYYIVNISAADRDSVKYDFPGYDQKHFPTIQAIPDEKLSIVPSSIIREMIQKTVYSISQEDNRYIYNGIYLTTEGKKLTIVGTDGRRLAAISRDLPSPIKLTEDEAESRDIVVHKKAVHELLKLMDLDDDLKIGIQGRDIFFRVGNAELSSRLLEGKFPDYKKVIPDEIKINIEVEKEELQDALSQVSVMTEQPSFQVRMALEDNQLNLSANTPDVGKAEISLPVHFEEEKLEIGFNVKYIADILNSLRCEKVELSLVDSGKPILIKDLDDEQFMALVMPMRI